uniref:Distal-less n=1 Tax=Panagrolaimus sp. PS1159 TaxID=55785 RepID=A0AC35F639_9BILA
MPYGGNMGMHHAVSAPGQLPQFPQQQSYYGNPSYPASPQQFMPPQMGYSNDNYTMNPGYLPNQPQYLPNHLQNINIHQAPPPPYPGAPAGDTTPNSFNEKKTKDYQKPACPPGPSNPFSPSGNQGKGQKKNSKQ